MMGVQIPQEILDFAQDQLASAREQTKNAKSRLEEVEKIEKVWDDFVKYASCSWYMHLLDLLNRCASIFQKSIMETFDLLTVIEETRSLAEKEVDAIIRRYPAYIEKAFNKANLPLDSNSRHPRYTLENGFFRLEVDEKKHLVRLSDHEGKISELPADIDAVIESVQKEHKRVFGRTFDGKKFLKRLRREYLAVIKRDKQQDGTSIPIRHITRRLGKNVRSFRTDEFLIDLSRLAQKGPFVIDEKRLDLQQTKNINQGMLLHGVAGRGYIGFIVFREV